MTRRTQGAWRTLFQQQIESQLSIKGYCQQHNISQSSFYKHKKEQKTSHFTEQGSGFIKAKRLTASKVHHERIEMQHQDVRILLPSSIKPIWLAEFVKALT